MTGPAADPGFDVLVVCTANICRSPVAAALLRAAWGSAPGVRVASAGLHARAGAPVDPAMARLVDVPVTGFAARQLVPDLVRSADLVLTMTRAQRAAVVSSVPAAVRRTFTLPEFTDLARLARTGDAAPAADPAARLSELVARAPRWRPSRAAGEADDIEDPYGRDEAVQRRVAAELEGWVAALVAAVENFRSPHRLMTEGHSPASPDR